MDKKKIALIILVVVIVGAYASFYAYASMVLIPEDKKVFKEELSGIGNSSITDSDISTLESEATQIESIDLTIIPADQRKTMADQMRNDPFITTMNSTIAELKKNVTNNQEIASRYDLLLKGDVANNIRSVYSQELINAMDKMNQIMVALPNDLENGDSKAVANDLRTLAQLGRELKNMSTTSQAKLETVVNQFGG